MGANWSITLDLLVDKENNRVIFAETKKDFVDVLFSFLTLPIGTIVRRFCKQLVIGCMNNLYKSVENLDVDYFQNGTSKTMLVCTRNSSANECRKLKVNVDDTESIYYYICSSFTPSHISQGLSTFHKTQCSCGSTTSVQVLPDSPVSGQVSKDSEVFIQGEASFLVTDNLKIFPMSSEATHDLLNNLGVQAPEKLERKSITVNLNEVSLLLKNALYSTTTLTDTFLAKPKDRIRHDISKSYSTVKAETSDVKNIRLKIICIKSTQSPIYAEAGGDFINFLFSMLTFPLGAVVKLTNQAPSLGSVTNLYKSVEQLNVNQYLKSEDHKQKLVSPKLALQYGCKDQLLDITEVDHPSWFCNLLDIYKYLSTTKDYGSACKQSSVNIDLVNIEGFVNGHKTFMVTDDLVVTPFSSITSIKFLEQFKVSIDNIETRVVSIGQNQALQILESSMTSNSVLKNVLKCTTATIPKKEKGIVVIS